MKKIISTVLVTLVCAFFAQVGAENKIRVDEQSVQSGTEQTVLPIYLENEVPIASFQLDLYLSPGIEVAYTKNRKGEISYKETVTKGDDRFEDLDHTIAVNELDGGVMRIVLSSNTNQSIWDTDINDKDIRTTSPVLNIMLNIASPTECGAYSVQAMNVIAASYDEPTNTTTKYKLSDVSSFIHVLPSSGAACSENNNVLFIYTAEGTNLTAAKYAELTAGKTDCTVDLRNAQLASDLTASAISAANFSLYYLPEGSTLTGNNFVVNQQCTKLVLEDGKDFVVPVAFTANTAVYNRNVNGYLWGTLCLPFAVQTNDDIQLYVLSEASTTSGGVMVFDPVNDEIPAYTPCVFKKKTSTTGIVSSNDVLLPVSPAEMAEDTPLSDWTLYGTVSKQVLDVTAGKSEEGQNLYYISQDKFYHATGTLTVNPFRAYFKYDGSNAQANYRIEEGTDGIVQVNTDQHTGKLLDLQGREVRYIQAGVVYLLDGVKVMFK